MSNTADLSCKVRMLVLQITKKNKTKLWLFPSVNNKAVLVIYWTTRGFQNWLNAWRLEGCHQAPSSIDHLTVSTAVLAHSIPPAHELQHRVEVAADWLKARPDGVQSPIPVVALGLRVIGALTRRWSSWIFSLLTDGTVAKEAQQEQERDEEGPAVHPGAQWEQMADWGGKQHKTQSQRRERNCRDLNFGLDAGTASYVEDQSPASISSFDLSVLLSLQISECVLVKEDSWFSVESR